MKGWLVLYTFGEGSVLPRHYKTYKMAHKFAEEHNTSGFKAYVISVEALIMWQSTGVDELEKLFKL